MGCAQEVGRLQAVDGDLMAGSLPDDACSLVVLNPLAAPIYVLLGQGVPSAASYDIVVPGAALMSYPLPGNVAALSAVVRYPGAVPVSDAGLHAAIVVTCNNQGVFVGPLA